MDRSINTLLTKCQHTYIPKHLCSEGKEIEPHYHPSEQLYWRCKSDAAENPYTKISIAEVSVNRSGIEGNLLCTPEDVLWDITESENEKYLDRSVIVLGIANLEFSDIPIKKITYEKLEAELHLVHDPLPCNYPHSLLRFLYNGTIVTMTNYKKTLGHKSVKRLRQTCKDELYILAEKCTK